MSDLGKGVGIVTRRQIAAAYGKRVKKRKGLGENKGRKEK